MAVQGVGSPSVEGMRSLLARHNMHMELHPGTTQSAGVALIMRRAIAPQVVRVHYGTSGTGRALGIRVQSEHSVTLLVSVYMPTGLDGLHDNDRRVQLASRIHDEVLEWAASRPRAHRVVVMGDMNETRTLLDRRSVGAVYAPDRLLSKLDSAGFVDAYRRLHPNSPGYTRGRESAAGMSQARLDYVWVRANGGDDVLTAEVMPAPAVSDHNPLLVQLAGTLCAASAQYSQQLQQPVLPNMRRANAQQKELMVRDMRASVGGWHGGATAQHRRTCACQCVRRSVASMGACRGGEATNHATSTSAT